MLNGIIRWSVSNRLVVLIGALISLFIGIYVALELPVDVFPDLTAPTVTVLTEAHSMAPEEVETLVTFPIETALNGATGVRRVRSASGIGISVVWVEFDWGTDIYRARQIVSEKLQLVSNALPPGISRPIMAPISSIMGEIMLIALSGPVDQLMEMRTLADWTLRRRLLALSGVSQVIPIGGQVRQYQVILNLDLMKHYGVTLDEAARAVESSSRNSSGGFYVQSEKEYLVRGIGRAQSLEQLMLTPVAMYDNVPIRLDQVAKVQIGPKVRRGTASVNAREAVILSIQKQPKANTLELTARIDEVLNDIERTLPSSIKIERFVFRQSDFIELAIENVLEALRDGAILVTIILYLFLLNFRTTFISVVAIPMSLIFTIFILKLWGAGINTMTLGGMAIAIGVLVDDAIIGVENVFRRLRENRNALEGRRKPALEVIFDASSEVRYPIVFATFIVMVVFVPLFALSGVEGRMLRPLGVTYIISIFASLLVALTITPAMCSYLLRAGRALDREEESWLLRKLKEAYAPILRYSLNRPVSVMLVCLVMLAATLALVPFLGKAFLPEFNEGTLTINLVTVPGTSLQKSDGLGRLAEEIILSNSEVLSTARRTGRAELDEHAQEVNAAEMDVRFQLKDRDRETFISSLRNQLAIIPGTNFSIGQPISHRIDHMLSGTRANIAVKLFGPDLLRLRGLAEQIRRAMESVEGVVDLQVEQQTDIPQTRIHFNRLGLGKHGLSVDDVARAVDIGLNGEVVGQILEEQKAFDLLVRFEEKSRSNIEQIRRAKINTPSRTAIPLMQVADVRIDFGPNLISREDVQRKIVIQCNVSGRDLRGVVDDIRAAIESQVNLPEGYYVVYGGQFESEQRASRTIGLLSLLAVLAIFLILYLAFGSMKLGALMMVNLPLALIGGIVAVFLGGGVLNVASMVGFITLLGIATRNGILLVSRYETLQKEGQSLREAIYRGSMERLSPILMTALTTGLALIPLALAGHEPGNEIQSPLAIVVLGGLLSSTFLNMVVIPALCFRFYPKRASLSNAPPE
ncbi:efflux RND transporter permease subunit [Acidobacteria bacterium AH-259-L09]|nr:efflux RND transporter permease subunit [Acidobacteria bacterium AH-259-L09]